PQGEAVQRARRTGEVANTRSPSTDQAKSLATSSRRARGRGSRFQGPRSECEGRAVTRSGSPRRPGPRWWVVARAGGPAVGPAPEPCLTSPGRALREPPDKNQRPPLSTRSKARVPPANAASTAARRPARFAARPGRGSGRRWSSLPPRGRPGGRRGIAPSPGRIPSPSCRLSLLGHALDHAGRRGGGNDPRHAEPGAGQKVAKLGRRALVAADHDEHLQVEQLADVGAVAGRDDHLRQQDPPAGARGAAAV